MINKVYSVIILCCLGVTLGAQNIDQVCTIDGSVYEGYISEQIPGERICVYAQKATLTVPTRSISNIYTVYRQFSILPESAKEWFRENADTTSVFFSTLEYKGDIIDDVIIFSKDDKETRYISFANKTYVLPWGAVKKTAKLCISDKPYGICDIITLKNGDRFTGFILEQIIGESMKVRTGDGKIRIISSADILSLRSEAINKDVSVWKQSPLLDRIILDDGSEEIDGFISSRVMGQNVTIIRRDSDRDETIPLTRIRKYQKVYNPDYVEYDVDGQDMNSRWETDSVVDEEQIPDVGPSTYEGVQDNVEESEEKSESVDTEESTDAEESQAPEKPVRYDYSVIDITPSDNKYTKITVNGEEVLATELFGEEHIKYASYNSVIDVNQGDLLTIVFEGGKFSQPANLYKTSILKYNSSDEGFDGKTYPAISIDDKPVYETEFKVNDDGQCFCEIIIRKKGVYFLSFNGFDSVLVINANYL